MKFLLFLPDFIRRLNETTNFIITGRYQISRKAFRCFSGLLQVKRQTDRQCRHGLHDRRNFYNFPLRTVYKVFTPATRNPNSNFVVQ